MSDLVLHPAAATGPTISASRLKVIGGEKGAPGCERRYLGNYLFGMKQAETPALARGSALHAAAEVYQATGTIPDPEGEIGTLLSSGAHLLKMCGSLLVEHEHVGELPDGTPFVAYLDGHSAAALHGTGTIVIQDLKTCSARAWALRGEDQAALDALDLPPEERALHGARAGGLTSPYALRQNIQAMLYAWILLCLPHWYCPPLPEGQYGPKHWQWWGPTVQGARVARLRWIYFLTKGNPQAWEETDFVLPEQAAAFMQDTILPLVAKINAIHRWHATTPGVTLDEIDRTPAACDNKGRWCGVYERGACNFEALGTPINDLIQLKVRKQMSPLERLAQLKAEKEAREAAARGGATPPPATTATPVQEAPAASPPAPTTASDNADMPLEASPVVSTASQPDASSAPETTGSSVGADTAPATRGQKAAATRARNRAALPATPPGAGINPPEAVEALAKLSAEMTAPVAQPAAPAAERNGAVKVQVEIVGAPSVVLGFTTEQIVSFLVAQGYTVTAPAAQTGGAQ